MRRANVPTFLMEGEVFVGINLSADHCAEHEWGLSSLLRDFGIPGKTTREVYGIKSRTATRRHPGLLLMTYDKFTYLVAMPGHWWNHVKSRGDLDRMMETGSYLDNEELVTAWDSGEFAIRVATPDGASKLKELYNAAHQKGAFGAKPDIAITLGRGGPFQNAGLVVFIPSRLPKEIVEEMAAKDLDHLDLLDAAKATGIEVKLKALGKQWFALSPSWASSLKSTRDGEVKTAHEVVFWLNPIDQQNNNYGWYTVEQLQEWAEDKGPIPKKRKFA